MGHQLPLFVPPPKTENELLDERLAKARHERMQRDATKPGYVSREHRRSRRKREVRATTESVKRISKRELELGRLLNPTPDDAPERPRTRDDCKEGIRPCPWVSCKHHLFLDVNARTGAIKRNFPDLEPDELVESCSLDVSDRGGETLENVGEILNLTRERIRQIEVRALAKAQASRQAVALRDFVETGTKTKRRLPVLGPEEGSDEHLDGDDAADPEPGFDVDRFVDPSLDED